MTSSRTPANAREMLTERAAQLEPARSVDSGQRFVEQQCLRIGDEHARERGALRLTAAQRGGPADGVRGKVDASRATRSLFALAVARSSPRARNPNATLSSTLRCGNSPWSWKTNPTRRASGVNRVRGRGVLEHGAVDLDASCLDRDQPGKHAQQRCLPGAVRSRARRP